MDVGTTLSQYRITAKLGEGGMGEVYRAEDTRLKREVAIKVLPAELADDPDRLARLEREAQVLAQLEHPNVAAVYGLEEAVAAAAAGTALAAEGGSPRGPVRFLVMQLAEGDTLDELLDRRAGVSGSGRVSTGAVTAAPAAAPQADTGSSGAAVGRGRGLPIDEVLPIAGGIADALEAAHERGIVHRDLKPANIKVAFEDGAPKVKVLDFGLAKAYQPEAASGGEDLSASPTMMAATQAGMIMGTAGYMSPEQARGQPVNQRTDIWAFGVVVYEMLTGQALFASETISDTMAAVLRDEIDLEAVPADTPLPLRRLLRRCLQRDTRKRLRDIADARVEIDEAFAGLLGIDAVEIAMLVERGGVELAVPGEAEPSPNSGFTWLHAALGVALVAAGVFVGSFVAPAVVPPDEPVLMFGDLGPVVARSGVISPDGTKLTLDISGDLWVRDVDTLDALQIEGGERFRGRPYWSYDSTRVAFFTDGLRVATVSDGTSRRVPTDLRLRPESGTWTSAGILASVQGRLYEVVLIDPDTGESQTVARAPAAGALLYPRLLPDGETLVYQFLDGASGFASEGTVVLQRGLTPEAPTETIVAEGDVYAEFWYSEELELLLLESARTGVWTLPLSRNGYRVTGPLERLLRDAEEISLSRNGTLVYRALTSRLDSSPFRWVDRSGAVLTTVASDLGALTIALSPDGTRVAFTAPREPGSAPDIWVRDLERGGQTRITDTPGTGGMPGWLGGDRLVYTGALLNASGNGTTLLSKAASGAGGVTELFGGGSFQSPDGSTAGRYVAFAAMTADGVMRPAEPDAVARFAAGERGRRPRGGRAVAEQRNALDGSRDSSATERGGTFELRDSAVWNLYYVVENGSDATIYRATGDNEGRPALSPDVTRVAYVSDASGADEVWIDTFPAPTEPVRLSVNGARNVRWSPEGDELFYDDRTGTLWAVRLLAGEPHGRSGYSAPARLFSSSDVATRFSSFGLRSWDVGPGGDSFLTVQRYAEGISPVNVIVNFPRWYRERREP